VPSARRLSQTLGGYGLVVQGGQSKLGLPCSRSGTMLCEARPLARKSCFVPALPVTVGADCPSRFAGGQRTVLGLPSVSGQGQRAVRPGLGVRRKQNRWLRPRRFGRSWSVSWYFTQLPVSQRLKPQCSVMQTHSNTKPSTALVKLARVQPWPWLLFTEVSAFKAKRQVIQQPPNPSFKRTRLRRSA